jgi:hypothetical protein
MRVGEIICRSENIPFRKTFSQASIRSSLHSVKLSSIVGGGDFRQTVIAAPSTACTRRAKKQESLQSNCIQKLPDKDSRANTRVDAFRNWTSTTLDCQVRKD